MAIAILAFMTLSVSRCQPVSYGNSESTATRNIEITHPQWSKEELHAIAQTLAGECYDDQELDKRRVCEVILNRVSSDNRIGMTVNADLFLIGTSSVRGQNGKTYSVLIFEIKGGQNICSK